MTPMGTDDTAEADRELRERLRRSDPLATRAARLDPTSLEAVMSELTRTPVDPASQDLGTTPPASRRRWLVPALAGAAAAAAVAVAVSGVLGGGSTPTPAPEAAKPALTLSVPSTDPATAMCMALSPELLAPAQVAFDGVVTSVEGGTATLTPSRWFRGERNGTVAVAMPAQVDAALVGAPQFEVGKRYLVAGGDGQIGLCGVSAEYSPELEALYRSAFAG